MTKHRRFAIVAVIVTLGCGVAGLGYVANRLTHQGEGPRHTYPLAGNEMLTDEQAIALAKQRAKIPADSGVEIVVYPPRKSFYELLSDQLSGTGESAAVSACVARYQGKEDKPEPFATARSVSLLHSSSAMPVSGNNRVNSSPP